MGSAYISFDPTAAFYAVANGIGNFLGVRYGSSRQEFSIKHEPKQLFEEPWFQTNSDSYRVSRALSSGVNLLRSQVGRRAKWIGHMPLLAASTLVDSAIGTLSGIASICTFGAFDLFNRQADARLGSLGCATPDLFFDVLRFLNPSAKIFDGNERSRNQGPACHLFLTESLVSEIHQVRRSNSFLERELLARFDCLVYGLAASAAKVGDALLGVVAATGSFVTFGCRPPLNEAAYHQLRGVTDRSAIFYAVRGILNPRTFPGEELALLRTQLQWEHNS